MLTPTLCACESMAPALLPLIVAPIEEIRVRPHWWSAEAPGAGHSATPQTFGIDRHYYIKDPSWQQHGTKPKPGRVK